MVEAEESSLLWDDGGGSSTLEELTPIETPQDASMRSIYTPQRVRERAGINRERRRLDRLSRRERLQRIRGHPLGGMTLLELENLGLLDVAIGEMTGHNISGKRGRGPEQRRSARLRQRDQQERGEGSKECQPPHCDYNSRGGGRSRSSSTRKRPASATWGSGWKGAPVGSYSGGGARISLRLQRPTSARPALHGAEWKSGKDRAGQGQEKGQSGSSPSGGEDYASDQSECDIVDYKGDGESPLDEEECDRAIGSYQSYQASISEEEEAWEEFQQSQEDGGSYFLFREGQEDDYDAKGCHQYQVNKEQATQQYGDAKSREEQRSMQQRLKQHQSMQLQAPASAAEWDGDMLGEGRREAESTQEGSIGNDSSTCGDWSQGMEIGAVVGVGGCVEVPQGIPVPVPGASYSARACRGGAPSSQRGRGMERAVVAAKMLRRMVQERQASTGRSLRQIYRHFDRRECGYVNASDLRLALEDLRIGLPSHDELLALIAIDGGDQACFGEFVTFITDPHHHEVQEAVLDCLTEQLRALGSSFHLGSAFAQFEEGPVDARELAPLEFLAGLSALGLQLNSGDAQRLIVRFDTHGTGHISATRFVAMVERSEEWQEALQQLRMQEEADEQANQVLAYHDHTGDWGLPVDGVTREVVLMAQYLGMRAISDSSLLWIAERALKEPLPEGWVRQRTQDGRKYYYNRVTQTSRWDHPLDPHYRALYYKHRFGGLVQEQGQGQPDGRDRSRGAKGRRAPKDPAAAQPCLLPRQRRPQLSKFTQDQAISHMRQRVANGAPQFEKRGRALEREHQPVGTLQHVRPCSASAHNEACRSAAAAGGGGAVRGDAHGLHEAKEVPKPKPKQSERRQWQRERPRSATGRMQVRAPAAPQSLSHLQRSEATARGQECDGAVARPSDVPAPERCTTSSAMHHLYRGSSQAASADGHLGGEGPPGADAATRDSSSAQPKLHAQLLELEKRVQQLELEHHTGLEGAAAQPSREAKKRASGEPTGSSSRGGKASRGIVLI